MIVSAIQVAYEVLVEEGYEPEAALMELHGSGELGEVSTRGKQNRSAQNDRDARIARLPVRDVLLRTPSLSRRDAARA